MNPRKIPCLNDGFVQLIDSMGSDKSICNAARVSYGNHSQDHPLIKAIKQYFPDVTNIDYIDEHLPTQVSKGTLSFGWEGSYRSITSEDEQYDLIYNKYKELEQEQETKDRNLIRYLMRHRHTTPFEMVSFVFLVRAPIHVARQWFRHRTWSYNEYSTRYKPAIDSFETTKPDAWRTQSKNNKQGSSGFIPEDGPNPYKEETSLNQNGKSLSNDERDFLLEAKVHYVNRLAAGVAREQARKDLPLSTYTEFYAKVDLHNLFHFLSLRLDSHAQLEIRTYAEAIAETIKPIVPVSYEAFEDYRLNGAHFSSQEMGLLKDLIADKSLSLRPTEQEFELTKPDDLSNREWDEFKEKLQ